MLKTLRIAALAAGLAGALFATGASAADFRLAKPAAAPSGELIRVAMPVAQAVKGEAQIEKTQRRGGGFRRGGGGPRVGRVGRGGGGFRRGRGRVGRGVAIGLGAAAALAIAGAAAANARPYGGSCRRWAILCDEGEGWACRRYARNCD